MNILLPLQLLVLRYCERSPAALLKRTVYPRGQLALTLRNIGQLAAGS